MSMLPFLLDPVTFLLLLIPFHPYHLWSATPQALPGPSGCHTCQVEQCQHLAQGPRGCLRCPLGDLGGSSWFLVSPAGKGGG